MAISARNKLRGTIEEIQLGDVMAHVVVRVGNNLIESAITRRSADELKLKKGDAVAAVVKATEVMIQKDFHGASSWPYLYHLYVRQAVCRIRQKTMAGKNSPFLMSDSQNHNLGSFDEGCGSLPSLQLHFPGRACRDD